MAPETGPAAAHVNGNGRNGATTKGCPPPITGSLLAGLKKRGAGGASGANAGSSSLKTVDISNADVPTGLVPAQFEVGRRVRSKVKCYGVDE